MNKQEMLRDYKKSEDKMCLAQVLDKIESSANRNKIEYTDFLDMYQTALVETFLRKNNFQNYKLYGGYEEAERKILIIYPEKYNEEMLAKNYNKMISILRIQLPEEEQGKLVHRNYLGGIVKLGLKREKVGDILVSNDGADILAKKEFVDILKNELPSLTRFENSTFEEKTLNELKKKEIKIEEIKIIVPSLRLDNIVASLARTSRNKAVEMLEQERVFLNFRNETKASKSVKVGDIITIRGKGRFVFKEISGNTKKGRFVIKIDKFI